MRAVALAGVLGLAACGDRVPVGAERELGLLNGRIPATMVSYLDFVPREFTSDARGLSVRVPAPASWRSSVPDDRYAAWLRSPEDRRTTGRDSMAVGVDCAGVCEAKAWPAIIAAQARREVPDEGLLGERALVDGTVRWGRDGRRAVAYAAWAAEGAKELRRCVVRLEDPDLLDAIAVFADACAMAEFGSAPPPSR